MAVNYLKLRFVAGVFTRTVGTVIIIFVPAMCASVSGAPLPLNRTTRLTWAAVLPDFRFLHPRWWTHRRRSRPLDLVRDGDSAHHSHVNFTILFLFKSAR